MWWKVINQTRDTEVAGKVARATSFVARFVGLLGKGSLPEGEGLHLLPCNSIHMFFMRFPIDAAFLDAQGQVVKLIAPLSPWRVVPPIPLAHSVLELWAGAVQRSGTREGDRLSFERL
jgi:uncharacterized membrane protein (UPF0127 family)